MTDQNNIDWPEDFKKVEPQSKNSKASYPVKVSVSHPLSGVRVSINMQTAVSEKLGWTKGDKISAFKSESDTHVFYQLTKRADGPFNFTALPRSTRVILCGLPEDGAKQTENGPAIYKIDGKILLIRLEKGENPIKKMTEGRPTKAASQSSSKKPAALSPKPEANETQHTGPIIWGESEDRKVKLAHGSGKFDQAAMEINRARGRNARQVTGDEVRLRGIALKVAGTA